MAAACQAVLDAWCSSPENCPHAATHRSVHARLDTTGSGGARAWRCYAEETLTADLTQYSHGSTFCTRHGQLSALLAQCKHNSAAPINVVVSPTGTAQPPPPDAPTSTNLGSPLLQTPANEVFAAWLEQCASEGRRCSCLQHGAPKGTVELVRRFTSVAFFIIVPERAAPEELAAQHLVSELAAQNATNAYVMEIELSRLGTRPMNHGVLNPRRARLTALQALQVSNEFFDLQLVHIPSLPSLHAPSTGAARSLLSLAAATLLLLPPGPSRASWRAALSHLAAAVPPEIDAVAAAAELGVELAAEGCGGSGGGVGLGCALGSEDGLLVRLHRLSRLNAHHLSCWEAPHCHDRMYVMTLDMGVAAGGVGWVARVPSMHRVERARGAPAGFRTVAEALSWRGKPIPFETGGANLDSLVSLKLVATHRARLATQFLTIPVGRDMMLWNVVAGTEGAYAIDQEGVIYTDGQVPWERRAMPYCLSVRDCYEKPLGALCGLPYTPPGRLHGAALTAAATELFAAQCDHRRPYPCANGCQASYEDCVRNT